MNHQRNEDRYPNPYLAASTLTPGRDHLEAMRQFLDEEQHRLHERLVGMENDDGSIPDDVADEWSMVKGKLDQTRLIYGLVVQGLLTNEIGEVDDE